MSQHMFQPGTPVCITQTIEKRGHPFTATVVGQVDAWEDLPTGSWFTHDPSGKLTLKRLRLRKDDGEVSLLVIDDGTDITRVSGPGP